MPRLKILDKTIKALFAKSGNICAFPDCEQVLITDENQVIGEICHIYDANKGGRYNSKQTDEDRRDISNLILFCPTHHKITHNVVKYPASKLINIKKRHENKMRQLGIKYKLSDKNLNLLKKEMDLFWYKSEQISKDDKFSSGYKMGINSKQDYYELFKELNEIMDNRTDMLNEALGYFTEENFKKIKLLLEKYGANFDKLEEIPYTENKFINRYWEYYAIGMHNITARLKIITTQMFIQYLETILKLNPRDKKLREKLNFQKRVFKKLVKSAYYID